MLEYAKSLFARKVLHSLIRVWSMSLPSSWFAHICDPVPLSNRLVLAESEKFKIHSHRNFTYGDKPSLQKP
jgi:hypothetical protein